MKFTTSQKAEIEKQFRRLTTRELYDHLTVNFNLNTGYTSFRMALYAGGEKKCKMIRWTNDETQFLRDHYSILGNIEIAKRLSSKDRTFTKKNIQKKMMLLDLKRTADELEGIKNNHKEKGVYAAANSRKWNSRKAPENERRVWICNGVPKVMIKIKGRFIQYARFRYIQLHGAVPEGYRVYNKDCNPLNVDDENLIILNRTLNREEKQLYRHHIQKYNFSLTLKELPVIKNEGPIIPEEPNQNLVSVKIGRMIVKVKPGTDIELLIKRFENRQEVSHVRHKNVNLRPQN